MAHPNKMAQITVGTMGSMESSKRKEAINTKHRDRTEEAERGKRNLVNTEASAEVQFLGKASPIEKELGDIKPKVSFRLIIIANTHIKI